MMNQNSIEIKVYGYTHMHFFSVYKGKKLLCHPVFFHGDKVLRK